MTADISIIVPCYNAEKYIAKCLDSLLAQTYVNIEILCVNDGSKDDTLTILQQYSIQDKRIKVFSQENSGPSAARNTGLKNVRSPYVMFCDSDDWYESQMCEKMLACLLENDVDIAVCDCNTVDEIGLARQKEQAQYYHLDRSGKYLLDDRQIADLNTVLWNKIFKFELIKKNKIEFPPCFCHEDACFVYEYVCMAQSIFFCRDKLYNYVRRDGSVMGSFFNKKNEKVYDFIFSMDYLYNFLKKNQIETNKLSLFVYLFSFYWGIYVRFMSAQQEQRAYEYLYEFCQKLPKDYAQELQSVHGLLRKVKIGKYTVVEIKEQRIPGMGIKPDYWDWKLCLCNKINLLNINCKNSVMRFRLMGLRILKLKKKNPRKT